MGKGKNMKLFFIGAAICALVAGLAAWDWGAVGKGALIGVGLTFIVLGLDPNGTEVKPVYVEPRILVSPFKLHKEVQ